MNISLPCSCGNLVAVPVQYAGGQVNCPACGVRLSVPPLGIVAGGPKIKPANSPRPSPPPSTKRWPWLVGALGLLVAVAGLVFFLNQGQENGTPDENQKAQGRPSLGFPKEKSRPQGQGLEEKKPPPKKKTSSEKPLIVPVNRPPTVSIVRAEPEVPRAGGTLTVQLEGSDPDGDAVTLQYRRASAVDWQAVPGGRLALVDLPAGNLTVEFRAVDGRGGESRWLTRTWLVRPVQPPTLEITKVDPAKPRHGDTLTVFLQGKHPDGRAVHLQYRTDPKAEWKTTADGRVHLTKVAGKLIVEFRASDDKGNSSSVERRIWTIPPPVLIGQPLKLEWKLKKGDTFYQDLLVAQKPTFRMQGLVFQSHLQYSVLSSFTVEKITPQELVVIQKVEAAKLLQADPTMQGLLAPAVAKLPGTTFTILLSPQMQVKKFVGAAAKIQIANPMLGGLGFQTASLLDLDGWREMAQATFFLPDRPLAKDTRWTKPMAHNWGPLGSWSGQTLYAYTGQKGTLHQFAYGHKMTYLPPKGKGMGLPLQITGAAFQAHEAAGTLLFDADKGRVLAGEERFHVRGALTLAILGQNIAVEIEEEQQFRFQILDRK